MPVIRSAIRLSIMGVALLLFTSLVLLTHTSPASAGMPGVTTETDENDGVCDADHCSLREAILAANASSEGSTITLPAGAYALTLPGADENAGETGDLDIRGDLMLIGAGAGTTTIDAVQLDRVLEIHAGTVEIHGVAITGGFLHGSVPDVGEGSGIANRDASLVLRDVVVQDNEMGSIGGGAGILNNGDLTVINSVIARNRTPGDNHGRGAGIANYGDATITGSRIEENRGEYGGGVYNAGHLTVSSSAFRANISNDDGGAIYQLETGVTIIEDTEFTGNHTSGAGIITNDGGQMELHRSMIHGHNGSGPVIFSSLAGNLLVSNSTVSGSDDYAIFASGTGSVGIVGSTFTDHYAFAGIDGAPRFFFSNSIIDGRCWIDSTASPTMMSVGHNIFSDATCASPVRSDLVAVDPMLGPLADNGGATLTHALLPGSPALDAGSDADLATDQRGVARPQGVGFDIGAYELEQAEASNGAELLSERRAR